MTPAIEAVFFQVGLNGAVVPAIWHLEVANSLQSAIRRGRITTTDRQGTLADLARLPIEIDVETATAAWEGTLALADRFGLTTYDAAYLDLAIRRHLPLATLDRQLVDAARRAAVEVFSGGLAL